MPNSLLIRCSVLWMFGVVLLEIAPRGTETTEFLLRAYFFSVVSVPLGDINLNYLLICFAA